MSRKQLLATIVACIVIGVAWGLASVFLLGNHYVVSYYPEDLPLDLMPPGDYSVFGKSVFFPGWASAQVTTIDGIIYYAGPNTDMGNSFLCMCSIGIGIAIVLCAALIPSVAYLKVRKVRTTS